MDVSLKLDPYLTERLRKSELLGPLATNDFEKLVSRLQPLKLDLGDLITQENAGQINLLAAGKVRILERLPDGDEINICAIEAPDCWSDSWIHGTGNGVILTRASADTIVLRGNAELFSDQAPDNLSVAKHIAVLRSQWEIFCLLKMTPGFGTISTVKLRAIGRYFRKFSLPATDTQWHKKPGFYLLSTGSINCLEKAGAPHVLRSAGDVVVTGDFGPFRMSATEFSLNGPVEMVGLSQENFVELATHNPELFAILSSLDLDQPGARSAAIPYLSPVVEPAVVVKDHAPPVSAEREFLPGRINQLLHQYPFIMQQSQMDCGITCIAMVALFYGKRIDINELRERAGVSAEGTSMLALAETCESIGFMARGIRGTYEGLLNARLPLICFWKNNHFVVLYEINKKEARVGDPAEGLITISREEFSRDFSKSALELVPTVELKRAPGAKNPLTILLPLLKPFAPQVRDVFAAGIVYQVLMIITPFFSQTIVDRVIVHEDISMLNMLLLGMILVSCFQSALTFARGVLISTLATKIDHALFVQFFKHLFSLPLKFFEQRTTGDILARFNENARITSFLSGSTITVLLDGAMGIVYLGVLFYYSWAFGLAALVYIALLMGATTAYTPLLRGYSNELFKKNVANDSCVIESVHGVEKIKAAAAENRTRWKWEILFVDRLSVSFKQQLASNGYSQLTQLVHLIGRILLMWLGAHLVISKTFTVGQYMAANMMAGMCVDPIMRVIAMWQQLQSVNISIERLGDVFRATPEQTGQKTRLPQIQGFIEFKNVTFRYNEHAAKNTLMNISLRVQPNQMVAIVGRSGCGKTSLVRLVQGLYLPTSGSVLIDGVDTNQIEMSDLRKAIGVVAQQEFFFSGTVRENLAFYAPDAPLEQIIVAAKVAGIHDKIQTMGSGYDTMLSEGGQNLSGGEKQRLAIARALLHHPRILIFDEATSALDSESERHIQTAMDAIRKGRTLIVVAHRLSTIKSADMIIVMDQGQILEAGNHQTLIEKKGLYFHLCSQQSI